MLEKLVGGMRWAGLGATTRPEIPNQGRRSR